MQTKSLVNGNPTGAPHSINENELSAVMSRSIILDDSLSNTLQKKSGYPITDEHHGRNKYVINNDAAIYDDDDIDTALSKLEKSLDVTAPTSNTSNDSTTADTHRSSQNTFDERVQLELSEDLFLLRHQKLTFKKFKSYYFVLDNACYLSYYKSKEDSITGRPIDKICLKGCELLPDLNLAHRKLGINLKLPSVEGMTEMSLRCANEGSYARWLSACKLASRNKTISDPAFITETNSILHLLQMQQSTTQQSGSSMMTSDAGNVKSLSLISAAKSNESKSSHVENENSQATNLLPLRMLKKYKLKQLNDKILEAYSAISHLDLFESKWHYIKAWQALPLYGISYFVVKIKGSRYKEVRI